MISLSGLETKGQSGGRFQFQKLAEGWLDQAQVLRLAERLLNHTEEHTYTNPIDIATVIHLLSLLVSTQVSTPQTRISLVAETDPAIKISFGNGGQEMLFDVMSLLTVVVVE